jgi:glutamate 5-kinase
MAAIGQSELMGLYDQMFSLYGHTVAQVLLTRDVLDNPVRRDLAENTFESLLSMGCVPIVNENDPVSTDELTKFGGNDILSAYVARVCHADVLINLSDVDGLYDCDPRKHPEAKLIERVEFLSDDLLASAGGAGTERGTGGMTAKLYAAALATEAGIPMFIMNGQDPEILYRLMDGAHVGTYFTAKKA